MLYRGGGYLYFILSGVCMTSIIEGILMKDVETIYSKNNILSKSAISINTVFKNSRGEFQDDIIIAEIYENGDKLKGYKRGKNIKVKGLLKQESYTTFKGQKKVRITFEVRGLL
jgi:single-stranded DNA-binding protein